MTILLALAGCAASRPYAAADSRSLDDQEPQPKALLNDADRAEIRAAFVSLIAEHEPVMKPAPAAEGVRWSDVQLAAHYACMDVEMAIMRTRRDGDHFHFTLRAANERTGELLVQRVDDERIYTATATIGLFGDDHETAQQLLAAFDRRMRSFGAKRNFDER